MKGMRLALVGVAFLCLSAVSGYLYYRTQAVDAETRNQVMSALRELRQLDAEWNANILKSRLGIYSDYDPLTTPLRQVRALRERLIRDVHMAHGSALEEALYRMETAFVDKEDLVEQFKSQNAVLKNSLRYFPTAIADLGPLLTSARAPAQAGPLKALETKADALLTDILRFNLNPEAELGERIAAAIDAMDAGAGSQSAYPDELREPLALLTRHARIVLRQRLAEDALLAQISATPTAQTIDTLSEALEREFRGMLQEKQRYRGYLFVYSAVLLVLLTYAAWRLIHSYQLIAQVNRRLQAANETLEQRVTERTAELERKSAQLEELATRDLLTGLINRRQLMVQLTQALRRAQRRGKVVALLFIDLDGFKEINDTHGHAVGDRVLQEFAQRTGRHVRKEDAFARLGGDEFVILLEDVPLRDGAIRLAEAVLLELHELTQIDSYRVRISASIGIASMRASAAVACSPDHLLLLADQAMYAAKKGGKNSYFFSPSNAWGLDAVPYR